MEDPGERAGGGQGERGGDILLRMRSSLPGWLSIKGYSSKYSSSTTWPSVAVKSLRLCACVKAPESSLICLSAVQLTACVERLQGSTGRRLAMLLRKNQCQDLVYQNVADVQRRYEAMHKHRHLAGSCQRLHIVFDELVQHPDKQNPDIGFCATPLQDVCQYSFKIKSPSKPLSSSCHPYLLLAEQPCRCMHAVALQQCNIHVYTECRT